MVYKKVVYVKLLVIIRNNYEQLNFNNPAQECISDNQCNSCTNSETVGVK